MREKFRKFPKAMTFIRDGFGQETCWNCKEKEEWRVDTKRKLQKRIEEMEKRLKIEEAYPKITCDELILRAGISLLEELLEALE
jgi:hypothetical protein